MTIVQAGDEIGALTFAAADGTDIRPKAASVSGYVTAGTTPGVNTISGELRFGTTSQAQDTTTRMTITSTGTVDVVNDVLTNNAKLKAIAKDISDTAVDVFVYDTRKDSDGGAWRKRTQNTSWYNEALNTATRGARKEFPSVAVIVAESYSVTIYDGDDPDMPMWMVFNGLMQSI